MDKKTENTINKAAQEIARASFIMGGELVSQGILGAAEIAKQEIEFQATEARANAVVHRLEDARGRAMSQSDPHLKRIIEAEVTYYEGELETLASSVQNRLRIGTSA